MTKHLIAALLAASACAPLAPAAGDPVSCLAPAPEASTDATASAQSGLFTRREADVAPPKRTLRGLYLTAADAYEMVSQDPARTLFIDVRTRGELQFIGMPTLVDAQVPYLVEATPVEWDDATSSFKLVVNVDFVGGVDERLAEKHLERTDTVVVICQAGVRAARAADALTRAGYTTVYTVVDGFEGDPVTEGAAKGLRLVNGWRNAGLPWTTRLERRKVYGAP